MATAPESGPRKTDGSAITWWLAATAIGVVALLLATAGLFLPPGGGASTNTAAGSSAGGSAGAKTVDVEIGEFYVKPAKISIPAGTNLTLKVTNKGTMPHDLQLDGKKGTKMLDPNASETVDLGKIDKTSQAWCTVPGHKQAGMVTTIEVTGGSGGEATNAAATGGSTGDQAAATDFAKIDPNAKPPADWKPYDPNLAPAPGGTEHAITLHATEKVMEVAPGVKQEMWTFNDQVPGPVLRGKIGDIFTVTLVNDGKMGHSIDFHASRVAWNDKMRTIAPGESLVYQFKADYAGAWMYHCGTNPTLHHIGNGMYGAVIIDPPVLAPVDHEFVMVQSELYLGPQGQPGDLTKMQDVKFDAVVFNGYWNQYSFSPIQVQPNQRIRVWVVDAGPSENSSFHIVGTIFDTVFKEGTYLLQPDARHGGSQALDLQPAQGGFVEFSFAETGFYPMVTHKFANAGKGALGLFRAGDAQLPTGMSH